MTFSKDLRIAKFLALLSLAFLILFIAQAIIPSPGKVVSAEGGETVKFDPYERWTLAHSDDRGWKADPSYWDTLQYPDIDGDGIDDVCGRYDLGIVCSLSFGLTFTIDSWWDLSFGDAQGWKSHPSYWATIRFPDVNGDGRDDVCGRSSNGMMCGISDGTKFSAPTNWNASFRDEKGWKDDPSSWETIQFPDLNGDGLDDVCGRTPTGIVCSLSNGQSFSLVTNWDYVFSNIGSWNADPSYWRTIKFPDVNGDGLDDVCGRNANGIMCATSNGLSFEGQTYWTEEYDDGSGWDNDPAYWGTIQFIDFTGDRMADICGRATGGIYCGNSLGTEFGTTSYRETNFSNANNWHIDPSYYATIQFPDVNGDGKADVCGRAPDGIYCARAENDIFVDFSNWQAAFSDSDGWANDPAYWATIQFPDVSGDGMADVCGRTVTGIFCAPAAVDDNPPPPTPNFNIYLPSVIR